MTIAYPVQTPGPVTGELALAYVLQRTDRRRLEEKNRAVFRSFRPVPERTDESGKVAEVMRDNAKETRK